MEEDLEVNDNNLINDNDNKIENNKEDKEDNQNDVNAIENENVEGIDSNDSDEDIIYEIVESDLTPLRNNLSEYFRSIRVQLLNDIKSTTTDNYIFSDKRGNTTRRYKQLLTLYRYLYSSLKTKENKEFLYNTYDDLFHKFYSLNDNRDLGIEYTLINNLGLMVSPLIEMKCIINKSNKIELTEKCGFLLTIVNDSYTFGYIYLLGYTVVITKFKKTEIHGNFVIPFINIKNNRTVLNYSRLGDDILIYFTEPNLNSYEIITETNKILSKSTIDPMFDSYFNLDNFDSVEILSLI